MRDYFLKAKDEPALWEALVSAGVAEPTDDGPRLMAGAWLDVIGPIVRTTDTGKTDADGTPIVTTTTTAGCHANLRVSDDVAVGDLSTVRVAPPLYPTREWAGGMSPAPLE